MEKRLDNLDAASSKAALIKSDKVNIIFECFHLIEIAQLDISRTFYYCAINIFSKSQ